MDEALEAGELAAAEYRQLDDPDATANALSNLGTLYQEAENYKAAEKLIFESMEARVVGTRRVPLTSFLCSCAARRTARSPLSTAQA